MITHELSGVRLDGTKNANGRLYDSNEFMAALDDATRRGPLLVHVGEVGHIDRACGVAHSFARDGDRVLVHWSLNGSMIANIIGTLLEHRERLAMIPSGEGFVSMDGEVRDYVLKALVLVPT